MTAPDRARPDVSESIAVERSCDDVWRAVADPHRVATWSPETTGARVDAAVPLAVGATFAGTNSRGGRRWSTSCRVVESIPGVVFTFDVTYLGLAVSRWRYSLHEIDNGCRVEEQWWDMRGRTMLCLSGIGTGVRDRATHNRTTMRATLEAMRDDLETR